MQGGHPALHVYSVLQEMVLSISVLRAMCQGERWSRRNDALIRVRLVLYTKYAFGFFRTTAVWLIDMYIALLRTPITLQD